jgi:GT2 family glycosyltransferase
VTDVVVAAVVVNFRTPELTIDCVRSLLASDAGGLHVVVVDNASGDGSAEAFRKAFATESRVAVIGCDVNAGYTGGNNAGFAAAAAMNARFAFVLNSDTIVARDCVRLLIEEAERTPDAALVVPRIFFGDPPDALWFGGSRFSLWTGRVSHVGRKARAEHGLQGLSDIPFATGCALLVRMDVLRAVGGFDEALFAYCEDLDLSLRVRGAGYRVRYVPQATLWHLEGVSHRRAGGQALRIYLHVRNTLRVLHRHARWYHWFTLGPVYLVDTVARFIAVSLRDRDLPGVAAVLRGVLHAFTGARHPIEPPLRAGNDLSGRNN